MNLKITYFFSLVAIVVLALLPGCTAANGSGNFFDDPPDCYYDSLFGCGTFDIPGDSSYYGYGRFAQTARILAAKSNSSLKSKNSIPNFSGNWNALLDRKLSSCQFATPLKVHGNFSIKQINDRVTMKLPVSSLSSYPLRGSASNKGIQASAVGFVSFCSFRASTNFTSGDARRGNLSIALRVNCPLQSACDVSYSGTARK